MSEETTKSGFELPELGGEVKGAGKPCKPNRIKARLIFSGCEQIGEKTFRQTYHTAEAVIECTEPKEMLKGHLVGVEVLGYEDEEFA